MYLPSTIDWFKSIVSANKVKFEFSSSFSSVGLILINKIIKINK